MAYVEKHSVSITTATGGGGTGYTPVVTGRIAAVKYAVGATGQTFATTADFTITTEDSGQTIWSDSNITAAEAVHPVAVASLPSGAASSLTEVPIYAAGERIKVVVAQGGNTKSGTFTVVIA